MNNDIELTLNSPMTKEDFYKIADVELEKTERLWFQTPSGRKVEFAPSQKWIPCKERLPKQCQMVLASVKDELNERVFLGQFCGEEYWYDGSVTAWMPLPEPYKEEAE